MRGQGSEAGWNRRPHRRAAGSGEVDGLTSSEIFRHPLLQAELLAAGPSTRDMCATSIGASCGWSWLTDGAAHSDVHSRSQPSVGAGDDPETLVLGHDHCTALAFVAY